MRQAPAGNDKCRCGQARRGIPSHQTERCRGGTGEHRSQHLPRLRHPRRRRRNADASRRAPARPRDRQRGHERGLKEIVVGRDGRLSGPDMVGALVEGLRATGMDVIDIGAVPTPVVYFGCYHLSTGSGVSVTGSHNPPDYNGFKIVLGGETLSEDAIQALYARIAEHRFVDGSGGLQMMDIVPEYMQRIANDIQVERQLKVVVDCGNGVAGRDRAERARGIGCEVEPLYCDVDGTFPNHHPGSVRSAQPAGPDPVGEADRTPTSASRSTATATGWAWSRKTGEVIFPDRLLMLFAIDILTRNPGATIIYDVKCTGHLQPLILQHGGSPLMWRTGHSLIKAKMKETDAALAGEMSGHFFFGERWYGFDDGIYAAARLLDILGSDPEGRDAAGNLRHAAQGRVDARAQDPDARRRALPLHRAFRAAREVRGRAHHDDRRRARRLAGRLGSGARVEHDAGARDALRRRHARRRSSACRMCSARSC